MRTSQRDRLVEAFRHERTEPAIAERSRQTLAQHAIVVDEDNSVLYTNFPITGTVTTDGKLHLLDVIDSQQQDVLRLVLGESMILVGVGVVTGLGIAAAASGLVSTLLFGLPPRDLASMVLAVAVMAGVSAVAGYLPARRASRVDPMVALHYE